MELRKLYVAQFFAKKKGIDVSPKSLEVAKKYFEDLKAKQEENKQAFADAKAKRKEVCGGEGTIEDCKKAQVELDKKKADAREKLKNAEREAKYAQSDFEAKALEVESERERLDADIKTTLEKLKKDYPERDIGITDILGGLTKD